MVDPAADATKRAGGPSSLRAAVFLLAGLLPWGVVTWSSGFYLVFALGSTAVGLAGFNLLPVPVLAPVTPGFAIAWVVGTGCYLLALASAALGYVDREDRRVTAGLFVFAGVSVLRFAVELSGQRGIVVLPVGTATLWLAALVAYRVR
ncbi:MAG: hypothetical protein ABEJ28_10335 [Salinigranum sp.]